jgi:hypothetical protein
MDFKKIGEVWKKLEKTKKMGPISTSKLFQASPRPSQ